MYEQNAGVRHCNHPMFRVFSYNNKFTNIPKEGDYISDGEIYFYQYRK